MNRIADNTGTYDLYSAPYSAHYRHHGTIIIFLILLVLFIPWQASAAQQAAQTADPLDPIASGLKMFWALMLVLGLILILSFLAKKYLKPLGGRTGGSIQILESRYILPKKSLVLIQVSDQKFLVGTSTEGVTAIVPLQDTTSFSTILESSNQGLEP